MANAGYRSFEAVWLGGASEPVVRPEGGYRSYVAPWIGGASEPVVRPEGGYRSYVAPWIGGAGARRSQTPVPPPIVLRDGAYFPGKTLKERRQDLLWREEEEIIVIMAAIIKCYETALRN